MIKRRRVGGGVEKVRDLGEDNKEFACLAAELKIDDVGYCRLLEPESTDHRVHCLGPHREWSRISQGKVHLQFSFSLL